MSLRATTLVLPLLLVACPSSDVGRPCNHGADFIPQSQTISFPSLACDHLLCVYADETETPPDPCTTNAECNIVGDTEKFVCNEGVCQLDQRYVIGRSMCSQSCSVDADCEGGDPGTACARGFACARIQSLGDHCCEKLCVCRDDLGGASSQKLERECSADAALGCCDKTPHPAACGS
ncbi:MAG: hypothetical protein K0V04_44650 [Deltaproteobacteria bacterium]|nr:hypothetical protein [Deltaproteobacteria bacterium]